MMADYSGWFEGDNVIGTPLEYGHCPIIRIAVAAAAADADGIGSSGRKFLLFDSMWVVNS